MDLFVKVHERKFEEAVPPDLRISLVEQYTADGRVGIGAELVPFQKCGGVGCASQDTECYKCLMDATNSRLDRCTVCRRIRCRACKSEELKNVQLRRTPELISAMGSMERVSSQQITSIASDLRAQSPDAWACCIECGSCFCYGCLDDKSAESLAVTIVEGIRLLDSGGDPYSLKELFKCSYCYWKSKPCTNPSCPNDIGVPTKRCGGCHLDRYCSVECQAAAYPDHVGKCALIQNRRAAAAEKKVM